jgi:hypothetical protein
VGSLFARTNLRSFAQSGEDLESDVLIAGMPRSGSTFSFNVVREALQARGTIYREPTDDILGAVDRSEGAQHALAKAHAFDAPSLKLERTGAIRIITTIRRIEDAIPSSTLHI